MLEECEMYKEIEIIKSHDMWEEDCDGWYDLYKVDEYYFYPLSDYWDNPEVPTELYKKFEMTLDGSKSTYDDMIKALYWDLVLTSMDVDMDFDTWCDSESCVNWMEKRMRDKFNINIKVVDHGKCYSDYIKVASKLKQEK